MPQRAQPRSSLLLHSLGLATHKPDLMGWVDGICGSQRSSEGRTAAEIACMPAACGGAGSLVASLATLCHSRLLAQGCGTLGLVATAARVRGSVCSAPVSWGHSHPRCKMIPTQSAMCSVPSWVARARRSFSSICSVPFHTVAVAGLTELVVCTWQCYGKQCWAPSNHEW